jgi:hypothetical protein
VTSFFSTAIASLRFISPVAAVAMAASTSGKLLKEFL